MLPLLTIPLILTTKSAKKAVDKLGYADMLLSSTEFEALPDYDKSKQMYLSFRHCASEDGAESARESCEVVCKTMREEMDKELQQAETAEERAEMQAMSHMFLPGFCRASEANSARVGG